MEIRKINAEDTWQIRHKVMWPQKDVEFIKLKNDTEGIHFGLYEANNLMSVISLFIDNEKVQFRKFATLLEKQGQGYGSKLLNYSLEEARKLEAKIIWCNARIDKTGFYEKFGLKETEKRFVKAGIQYIVMEKSL
ncbi:GNAT family N-acetyltransferase [Clostridium sp. DL1XJH146]